MHILVTGGTGFIGAALIPRLLAQGHELSLLSRRPAAVAEKPTLKAAADVAAVTRPIDAVINLAGQPLPGRRWSPAYKAELRASRILYTERLGSQLMAQGQTPKVWLNGSAIGYYGDCGTREVDEDSPPGGDFAASLCRDWEQAGRHAAEDLGARYAAVRTGLVLGPGGALKAMLPAFRLGLGGPLGSGDQMMSWIHRDDLAGLFVHLLEREDLEGAFNGTAPTPVANRDFAQALGAALHRPAVLPMPGPVLRLLVGEMAELLLTGQAVLPRRTQASDFSYRYPELSAALAEVLG
ncbi:MAG: TIGR01777 family protein [Gammaproteobacteria bacterium]|nr:TIGR01777 family protein [Gammaproteobacteria bacterium]